MQSKAGAGQEMQLESGRPKRQSDWRTYRRLLAEVRPYWALFAVSVVAFLAASGAEAYFLKLFGSLIDNWQQGLAEAALFIPLAMLGAALVRGAGEVLGEITLSQVSFTVVHNLRVALFEQLLHLPSAFFDANSQGHLVSRITFNVAQLRDTGTDALKSIIQDGGKVIVFVAYMFYLSWALTLIFIAAVPVVALVVLYASRRFRGIAKRIQTSMGDVTHVAAEAVSGYRVVRIFGGEDYERQRFQRVSRANRRRNLKMVATKVASTQIVQVLVVVAIAVLIGLLARPDIGYGLSTGELVIFLGLAGMLARPIRKLTEVNARLQKGLAAAEDVFAQLDAERESNKGVVQVDRVQGRVEFRDVCFTYAAAQGAVLRDVNLSAAPGQTVALVGRSGSGKTTLASLIPRFREAESGQVLIDGVPVEEYDKANLRSQIALVTQQVTLFNDTLRANIAYGALAGADADAIEDAVRRAHADGFISRLPNGLDTVVGDDGVLLSGGERQRIAIARALLKDAPILILDEATSALDGEAERTIQAALEEVMRGRTTIVIAHRLSTVERADVIHVLDEGRIVEQGDHAALLAQGKLYASLYHTGLQDGDVARSAAAYAAPPESRASPANRWLEPLRNRLAGMAGPVLGERRRTTEPLVRAWRSGAWWTPLARPAAWLFGRVAERRRWAARSGRKVPWRAPVPVIVVGNLTVGGTGKTPLVIWLVQWLQDRGLRPGVVSRGYGGSGNRRPLLVAADADPARCGDEPVLIAERTGCPVAVCRDRAKAVEKLLEAVQLDLVIADDGLQHYGLARDLEIVVVDGRRKFGNGRLLPAGPLREPPSRALQADWVVSNGRPCGAAPDEALMRMRPIAFVNLHSRVALPPADFAQRHERVHAVAGIGNPEAFAGTLAEVGLQAQLHPLPDHHAFTGGEVLFDDELPVVCTEKDAVKLRRLATSLAHCWALRVEAEIDAAGERRLQEVMEQRCLPLRADQPSGVPPQPPADEVPPLQGQAEPAVSE